MRILVIGSGNLGTHLIRRLTQQEQDVYLWHYERNKGIYEANSLGIDFVDNLEEWQGDLVFLTVKDSAIEQVSQLVNPDIVKVHCSGAMPMSIISRPPRGVIYPLQSFIKSEPVEWDEIPVFITYEPNSEEIVKQVASLLSPHVYEISDEQRLRVHLTAVIVNNFVNFSLGVAYQVIQKEGLSTDWFIPLLKRTAERFQSGKDPLTLQTGPARRGDIKTIHKHTQLLANYDKNFLEFYKTLSDIISRYYDDEKHSE